MAKISVDYMGLELSSPVVVGACDLVDYTSNLQKIQRSGAGALVYKSLFEEQIQLEEFSMESQLDAYNERNAEMTRVFPGTVYSGPDEFLDKFRKARKAIDIPLIGSLNAVFEETWVRYADALVDAGADGLELNLFNVPFSADRSASEVEEEQIRIVGSVVKSVRVPVSVKLSPYYTNLPHFLARLNETGINGVVLFNKLFQPDIDLESQKHMSPWNLSSEKEYRLSLRYAGLLHGQGLGQVIAGHGVMEGDDLIRLLLAGAQAVQVVSTLYRNGLNRIEEMNLTLRAWMQLHKYSSIEEFRGKLSRKNTSNPIIYKRAQYIDMMLNSAKSVSKNQV